MIVNQKQLAECLGISSRRVRQLREEGLFKLTQEGKGYNLEKSIQEYIEYKVNAETGRRASISKEEVQAEHEEVKKQISLLKLRRLRRELHEASDVEAFLTDMLLRFKNRLLSVPSRLAMQIAGESDINEIIQIIKKELGAVLEELSEYDPDEIDGGSAGGDYDPEEDDLEGGGGRGQRIKEGCQGDAEKQEQKENGTAFPPDHKEDPGYPGRDHSQPVGGTLPGIG